MNKVVHFEIPADDVSRAVSFYRDAFGWEITGVPFDPDYFLATTVPSDEKGPKEAGAINGAITKWGETSQAPILVINSYSIDESLKKVEAAGGTIAVPKFQVGDIGLYAHVKDPEGNIVGVWQDLQ